MSTLAYGQLTTKRLEAEAKKSTSTSPPGVKTYVDALAALVPAEVLTIHGLCLSVTTKVENNVTKITDPETLYWAFIALIILSIGLYAISRVLTGTWDKWEKWDWVRMAIPPLAFIGWTMLQRSTAFDAVYPSLPDAPRTIIPIFLAVVLGGCASLLAVNAHKKTPEKTNGTSSDSSTAGT